MTIIGILAAIAVPALRDSPQRAREATLREDLFTFRTVIDQYHGDKGVYPPDLQTLVTAGYIRKIPIDPMTKSADTWVRPHGRTVHRGGSERACRPADDSRDRRHPQRLAGKGPRRHPLQGLVMSR